ncbi:hypothetical protein SLE2022_300420 [Rubroshorea leprosula]
MGRAPCCDKAKVKKGPWSPEEDAKLKAYIEQHGTGGNWIALPQKIGLKRCGKSCRLRWLNYLRPNIKHGGFSEEEDNIICSLYITIGSRWSIIAAQLPGRTDNDIKNYWNTRLKKKLLGKQRKEQQTRRVRQDIKRETEDYYSLPSGVMNHGTPCWPELPAVMPLPANSNQDSHFNDQESLSNLLIELGGKFSNDHPQQTSFQHPFNQVPITQDQLPYEDSMTMFAPSSSMSSISSADCSQLSSANYDVQGLENFQVELSELIYGNQQQFDELGSSYGMENMLDGSSGISSVESNSWGDINSLAYPQIVSGFQGGQQSMPQVSNFEGSSYFGPH